MPIGIGIGYFAPGITQFILENYLDCHGSISAGLYDRDSPKRKCRQMQKAVAPQKTGLKLQPAFY
jgi:hypothetical protein